MSEKSSTQGPLAVRLTSSSRTPNLPSARDGDLCRQSSAVDGQMCFGDEWLDDGEEEAMLHQALDVLGDASVASNNIAICASSISSSELIISKSTVSANIIDDGSSGDIAANEFKSRSCSCENHGPPGDSSPKCATCGQPSLKRDEKAMTSVPASSDEDQDQEEVQPVLWKKARTADDPKVRFTMTPLRQFKGKYLWVSDLTAQAWCERQLLYDLTFEGPPEILETEAMKVGSEMHLKRELEVHVIKQIAVNTREDKWAVKFLNILSAINQLLLGGEGGDGPSSCVVREMPIFGMPFQTGAFVVGVIDEIRYNAQGELELVEFKTRAKARSLPSKAQRRTHKLQVMLYKQLFDEVVCGELGRQTILDIVGLDPDAAVNDEIAAHAFQKGLGLSSKFGDFVGAALDRFRFLPKIGALAVEYSSQDDREPFAVDDHPFDPVWLRERLAHYNAFWEGGREAEGVDVEDAWKCNFCNYADECDWRKKMHEACLSKNSTKRVKVEVTK